MTPIFKTGKKVCSVAANLFFVLETRDKQTKLFFEKLFFYT